MRASVWLRAGLLFASLLGALGCGGTSLDSRLASYAAEVGSVVGAEATTEFVLPRTALPDRRARRIDTDDHRAGGRDFLAFQGCRLGELVGQRNSPLGRVMVPTRRLRYEAELLEAAADCVGELEPERADRLNTLVVRKRDEIGAHVWNAVWLSEEVEAHFSESASPFAARAGDSRSQALAAAASALTASAVGAPEAAALERALARLRDEAPTGPMLRGIAAVGRRLDRVAQHLERLDGEGCDRRRQRVTKLFEARYLPLQGEVATLDRDVAVRLDALAALFGATQRHVPTIPAAMQAWRDALLPTESDAGLWRAYRDASMRHVEAWRPTLRACGVLPEAGA